MKALILLDIQNDFVPGGALPVPRGNEVVPVANRLVKHFDWIIATQDWHPKNHSSFASTHHRPVGATIDLNGLPQILWPDHCVQNSKGAELVQELDKTGIQKIIPKGTDPNIDSYSAFFDNGHRKATELESFLRRCNIDEIYIMGLATDYCVKWTALDAVHCGFRTNLILDGCRGINLTPRDIQNAIEEMKAAGVKIGSADTLIEQRCSR